MSVLSVTSFGGGIALEGSSDAERTDELRACDSYDIGPRGQLVVASDLTAWVDAPNDVAAAMARIFAVAASEHPVLPLLIVVGTNSGTPGNVDLVALDLTGALVKNFGAGSVGLAYGDAITMVVVPYVSSDGKQRRTVLINGGARPGQQAGVGAGLVAMRRNSGDTDYEVLAISQFDALGTGPSGEFPTGTKAVQLKPRGITFYNNHVFLWGYDHNDAVNQDGPNRLMFSNIGNPLKYGFDPDAAGIAAGTTAESDRSFVDSDAFTIGGAGTVIRAGYVWAGKLWLGTQNGLHYVEGFGRESFLANGAVPIARSRNVIGPRAMIEGPDGLLYGISDEGLWQFDGATINPVGDRLRDYASKSIGYWDLIWTDTTQSVLYPSQTNQDLVWLLADNERQQVWVVIPFCNATTGFGFGSDTVILKYHVRTGGFSRQVFTGKSLTAGLAYRSDALSPRRIIVATPGASKNLSRFALKATSSTSPPLPTALPDVTVGTYAPHGPDGVGIVRKLWLTLSWEAGSALPLAFTITPSIDGKPLTAFKLTIGASQPGSPANGDLWVDTSATDTNLGNGTAGSFIPASAADFLLHRYVTTWAKWVYVPGMGQQGTRVTIPMAHDIKRGARVEYRITATTVTGRYQVEGLGIAPATVRADA